MNLLEAIDKANDLRPNAVRDEHKAMWIYQLEGDFAEMYGIDPPVSPYPNDDELLIPHPYDEVYVLYLCAMIDNANEEVPLYQNDMALANAAINRAKAAFRRHNRKRFHNWRTI